MPNGATHHLDDRLLAGLDTLQEGRVRELELVLLGGRKLVVRSGLGDALDKGLEVAGVALQLEAVEVKNVSRDVVEETGVLHAVQNATLPRRRRRTCETMIEVQVVSDLR
jgi:hypothetical protein